MSCCDTFRQILERRRRFGCRGLVTLANGFLHRFDQGLERNQLRHVRSRFQLQLTSPDIAIETVLDGYIIDLGRLTQLVEVYFRQGGHPQVVRLFGLFKSWSAAALATTA